MKRDASVALLVVVCFSGSATAQVLYSRHDFSTTSGGSELCDYCHTPHDPAPKIPLWNRKNPSGADVAFYKDGPRRASADQDAQFRTDSVSLFCLSCHDGYTAPAVTKDRHENNDTLQHSRPPALKSSLQTREMSASHPFGFSYTGVQTMNSGLHRTADLSMQKAGIRSDPASAPRIMLYGKNRDQLECPSCHMVHEPGSHSGDKASGRFLRMPNNGSRLCLSCHNK